MQRLRWFFYLFSIDKYFDFFIMMIVILNVLVMALDGNLLDTQTKIEVYKLNFFFNAVFILEFAVKIVGLGPISNNILK